jgi:hypothetical protein
MDEDKIEDALDGAAARRQRRLANLKKPWQKGQSGNPKGKPKGALSWKTALKQRFADGLITQYELVDRLMEIAKHGEDTAALGAIKLMMDRMEGLPGQKVEIEAKSIADLIRLGHEKRVEIEAGNESYLLTEGTEQDSNSDTQL